jgi:hypothetical protein
MGVTYENIRLVAIAWPKIAFFHIVYPPCRRKYALFFNTVYQYLQQMARGREEIGEINSSQQIFTTFPGENVL